MQPKRDRHHVRVLFTGFPQTGGIRGQGSGAVQDDLRWNAAVHDRIFRCQGSRTLRRRTRKVSIECVLYTKVFFFLLFYFKNAHPDCRIVETVASRAFRVLH